MQYRALGVKSKNLQASAKIIFAHVSNVTAYSVDIYRYALFLLLAPKYNWRKRKYNTHTKGCSYFPFIMETKSA